MQVAGFPVVLIETNEQLTDLFNQLLKVEVFAFDTEFDRFRRRYGFNLLVLQIFDGKQTSIIKVNKQTDLSAFIKIFEQPEIVKVVYSGSEDIQLIKLQGANPVNIYDLQIAAKLTNHKARSYSDLVTEVCGETINKSHQKSDWGVQRLSAAQLEYAAKDVIFTYQIYKQIVQENMKPILQKLLGEENKSLECIEAKPHQIQLSRQQKDLWNKTKQTQFLALKYILDKAARHFDVPPYMILSDAAAQDLFLKKEIFRSLANVPTSYGKLSLPQNKKFLATIDAEIIRVFNDVSFAKQMVPPEKKTDYPTDRKSKELHKENFAQFKEIYQSYLEDKFGTTTAAFLVEGLKGTVARFNSSINGQKAAILKTYLEESKIEISEMYV